METPSFEKEPKIEIKEATPEDVRGIQEVLYQTWLETYPNEEVGITKEDIEESYKDVFTDEAIAKKVNKLKETPLNERPIIAKDAEKVIGTARGIQNEDINQLKTIYVLPEYQGRGVGMKLWEEVKKRFDPEKDTIVHVVDYNEGAIAFYKKLGFEDTGKRFTEERFKMPSGATLPEMEMLLKAE